MESFSAWAALDAIDSASEYFLGREDLLVLLSLGEDGNPPFFERNKGELGVLPKLSASRDLDLDLVLLDLMCIAAGGLRSRGVERENEGEEDVADGTDTALSGGLEKVGGR